MFRVLELEQYLTECMQPLTLGYLNQKSEQFLGQIKIVLQEHFQFNYN